MKEGICYSHKFPKISELIPELDPSLHFNYLIIVGILITFVCILLNEPLLDKLFFLLTALFFFMFHLRVRLIKRILIKKIEQVFEENSTLSKQEKLDDHLLQCNFDFSAPKNKDKYFRIALISVLILSFFLLRIISINMWFLLFTVVTLGILINLQYIFEYLRKLMESYYQNVKVTDNKDSSELFFNKDSINLDWNQYETKWKKLLIYLVLIVLVYVFLLDFQRVVYLLLIVFIILGFIIVDVNKIADKCLTVLGSHDEYIKSKLGMNFKPSKDQTFSPFPLFDEEEMAQENERIKNLLSRNVNRDNFMMHIIGSIFFLLLSIGLSLLHNYEYQKPLFHFSTWQILTITLFTIIGSGITYEYKNKFLKKSLFVLAATILLSVIMALHGVYVIKTEEIYVKYVYFRGGEAIYLGIVYIVIAMLLLLFAAYIYKKKK